MDINIQKLQTAVTVANCLSFSEAAIQLQFSPSAVSKQISALEQELGVTLFDRHSRSGVSLSNAGRILLPKIHTIVDDMDSLENAIKSINERQTFWLGTKKVFPNRIIFGFVSKLMEKMPDVQLKLEHADDPTLVDLIRNGKLDAGLSVIQGKITYNPGFITIKDKNLVLDTVFIEDEVLLMHPTNPLAEKETLTINDVLSDPDFMFLFISPDSGEPSVRQNIFINECKKRGLRRKMQSINMGELSISSAMIKKRIAEDPKCVALYPPLAPTEGIVERKMPNSPFTVRIICYYMKNNRSHSLKAFKEGAAEIHRAGGIKV